MYVVAPPVTSFAGAVEVVSLIVISPLVIRSKLVIERCSAASNHEWLVPRAVSLISRFPAAGSSKQAAFLFKMNYFRTLVGVMELRIDLCGGLYRLNTVFYRTNRATISAAEWAIFSAKSVPLCPPENFSCHSTVRLIKVTCHELYVNLRDYTYVKSR